MESEAQTLQPGGSDDSSTGSSDGSSDTSTTTSDTSSGRGSPMGSERGGSEAPPSDPARCCECAVQVPPDTEYAAQVRAWTLRIPIGLGLCPWAGQSHRQGRLRFVTCHGDQPSDVERLIVAEAEIITGLSAGPMSSTLIVCPHVVAWRDFGVFDDWVNAAISGELNGKNLHDEMTFVTFHPDFLRWRGLPEGVEVGSAVRSHWGMFGRKSACTAPATVIDTSNTVFGMQKVRVRFRDSVEDVRQEQFVPIDWIDHSATGVGPPLPDNAMHRAPHPTVHLIRNKDLSTLCMRDVSRVKRRNAQRMMNLGWRGVDRQLHAMCTSDL